MSDDRSAQEIIAAREVIKDSRNAVTARVSETTRYIGFGLLAIFYGVISGTDPFFVDMHKNWPGPLRVMALCGVLAVLLDYLQYLFFYLATEHALDRRDKPNLFDGNSLVYRLSVLCFWLKQGAALSGCSLLIFLVAQDF